MDIAFEDIIDKQLQRKILIELAQLIGILKDKLILDTLEKDSNEIMNAWLNDVIKDLDCLKSPSYAPDPVTKLWPGHRKTERNNKVDPSYQSSFRANTINQVCRDYQYMSVYGYQQK